MEKCDYSAYCTMNDDEDDRCWKCTHFVFPIGCMFGEQDPSTIVTTYDEMK